MDTDTPKQFDNEPYVYTITGDLKQDLFREFKALQMLQNPFWKAVDLSKIGKVETSWTHDGWYKEDIRLTLHSKDTKGRIVLHAFTDMKPGIDHPGSHAYDPDVPRTYQLKRICVFSGETPQPRTDFEKEEEIGRLTPEFMKKLFEFAGVAPSQRAKESPSLPSKVVEEKPSLAAEAVHRAGF